MVLLIVVLAVLFGLTLAYFIIWNSGGAIVAEAGPAPSYRRRGAAPTIIQTAPPPIAQRQYFYYSGVPYYAYGGYYYNPMGLLIDDMLMLTALNTAFAIDANRISDPVVINDIVEQNDPIPTDGGWDVRADAPYADSAVALNPDGSSVSATDAVQDFQDNYTPDVSNGTADFGSSSGSKVESFDNGSSSDGGPASFDNGSGSSTDTGSFDLGSYDGGSSSSSNSGSSSSWDSGGSSSNDSGSSFDSGSSSFDSGSSSFDGGSSSFGGC